MIWNNIEIINAIKPINVKSLNNDFKIKNISIDTRNINNDSLFIAIKGKKFNGHNFIKQAQEKGANSIIAENEDHCIVGDLQYFIVKDSIKALQDLAYYRRKQLKEKTKIIAVTGSTGKTTVKEIISYLLKEYKIHYNFLNYNNHIGLPLTIAKCPKNIDFLIVEMGTSSIGEIDLLSKIAQPNISIINNIGTAHIGKIGSVENILLAKSEIFNHAYGTAILFNDDKFEKIKNIAIDKNISNVISFGYSENSDLQMLSIEENKKCKIKYKNKNIEFFISQNSKSLFHNFTCALSAISSFDDIEKYKHDTKNFLPPESRGSIKKYLFNRKHISVFDVSYNANLESFSENLQNFWNNFSHIKGRKIAFIGSMKELGNFTEKLHIELANIIVKMNFDIIYLIGEETKIMINILKSQYFYPNINLMIDNLTKNDFCDKDTIFVQGSNNVKMNSLIKWFEQYSQD
ncbi:MAG: UDP-N-acetylmuramoyl-tripeptide--D-alanyl-D- alanine ligase [Candidatus Xenolissoclinum pacificiensis L6]|uniref:UDP-N-acetylmuramoyl-tripeptide--D-alanyl-D-alanine ligase n=1 Tax=Candidatus Xenolissoclinum pacificiensis L6 TaxID=1401685 RepID=W2V2X7_9RICK|nr:MAG: UDP-N-acetylmuramoyl-tripeptide--D-alanyl-D- alanine ligase [Candidatus Xenolissoclinum pacificiensis L6]